jgi:hypothetical protein
MVYTLTVNQSSAHSSGFPLDILAQLRASSFNQQSQPQWVINPRRKNGVILYKPYHAEFAGPGAVIGGIFDPDVIEVLPVGNLSLIQVNSFDERQRSYLIRRQWIRLLTKILENPNPIQRAQVILNQFENWFDPETATQVSNHAFARLVGVLPQTIAQVRHAGDRPDIL